MLLEIKDICKVYRRGKVRANDNISLSIKEGEVFGLLGPNGAGKTTLVNQIVGLAKPTSGSIHINGVDAVANPGYARQACSFQAQAQAPIVGLTPPQAIELCGRIRGGRKVDVRRRTRELIELLQIEEWNKTIGMEATGGVRRLVSFCMAVVEPGDIVIFDEPTNDIDPLRRRLLWQEVRSVSEKGSAVLLVTHNVLEAERVVDRLAIVDKGKVLGIGTPAELKTDENGSMRLELVLEPDKKIPELPDFLLQTASTNRRIIARVEQKYISSALEMATSLQSNGQIEEFSLSPATLEDVYIKTVGSIEDEEISGGATG